jgi:hypothetical protein
MENEGPERKGVESAEDYTVLFFGKHKHIMSFHNNNEFTY